MTPTKALAPALLALSLVGLPVASFAAPPAPAPTAGQGAGQPTSQVPGVLTMEVLKPMVAQAIEERRAPKGTFDNPDFDSALQRILRAYSQNPFSSADFKALQPRYEDKNAGALKIVMKRLDSYSTTCCPEMSKFLNTFVGTNFPERWSRIKKAVTYLDGNETARNHFRQYDTAYGTLRSMLSEAKSKNGSITPQELLQRSGMLPFLALRNEKGIVYIRPEFERELLAIDAMCKSINPDYMQKFYDIRDMLRGAIKPVISTVNAFGNTLDNSKHKNTVVSLLRPLGKADADIVYALDEVFGDNFDFINKSEDDTVGMFFYAENLIPNIWKLDPKHSRSLGPCYHAKVRYALSMLRGEFNAIWGSNNQPYRF